jgi:hypothetical protein
LHPDHRVVIANDRRQRIERDAEQPTRKAP